MRRCLPVLLRRRQRQRQGRQGRGEANRYTKWTPRLLRAAYNYQYAQKDPGLFAHNPDYAAQFLYDSLEDLAAGGVKVDMTGMVRPAVAK